MRIIDDSKLFKELVLHSFSDKPSMVFDNKKVWHKHGMYHRTNGPALIEENITGATGPKEKYSKKRGWYHELYFYEDKEVTPFPHYRESL